MTPAHKTSAILLLAGLVAGGSALLSPATRGLSTPPPPPPSASSAEHPSGLRLTTHMQSSHLLLGTHETHMAVTIEAPIGNRTVIRPPVDVAIVIDRSGSMSGEKLQHAKRAARQLVNQLRSSDRVAVVAYGSDVDIVLSSTPATHRAKSSAYRAIDSIYPDGGTNLSGGLLAGSDEIARNLAHPGASRMARTPSDSINGAVNRIVLISDGLANEGVVNRDQLAAIAAETAARGISITTVGVGLDFDEQTMASIAVNGHGNYYFAESSAALAGLFRDELDKLSATTATRVRLALTPAPGIEILEAYGYPVERIGGQMIIPIADLHANEMRKVVLRVRVDGRAAGPKEIAAIDLSFLPSDARSLQELQVSASAQVTREEATVIAGRDRDAIRHIERARTAWAIDEATRHYESGDASAAIRVIQARRQQARSMAESTGDMDLAGELDDIAEGVYKDIQNAPASSPSGQRARKKNRAAAFELVR